MTQRTWSAIAICCLLAVSVEAVELGRAEGTVTVNGVVTELRFAYGRHAPSERPGAAEDIVLLLTSQPLAASTVDNGAALYTMIKQGSLSTVEIRLDEKRQNIRTVIEHPGTAPINIIGNIVTVTPVIASQRLIEANVGASGDNYAFSSKFRAAISASGGFAPNPAAAAAIEKMPAPQPTAAPPAPVPVAGKRLPRGGGDAGVAYLAFEKALRKGDVAAMKTLMTAQYAKEFDQVAALLPIFRAMEPINIEVVGATIDGNTANLQLKGTPVAPGGSSSGTATVIKEGGRWKVAHREWIAGAAGAAAPQPPAIVPVTKGTTLPADGGAPGQAWREFDKAMSAGDVAGIKKHLTAEGAGKFDQFKDLLDLMQGSRGVNAKVMGGLINADKATLQLKGSPATLAELTGSGTVTMVKENGAWKVAGEEWTPKKP
ncbi:MAG TPA: hypothetical protein VII12_06335 [Thermoanaerobaculia bacterium]